MIRNRLKEAKWKPQPRAAPERFLDKGAKLCIGALSSHVQLTAILHGMIKLKHNIKDSSKQLGLVS